MEAEDYLKMSEKINNEVFVNLSDKERDIYETLRKDLVVSIKEKDIDAVNSEALSNKLLQMASGSVYDEDKNMIRIHDRKIDALEDLMASKDLLKDMGQYLDDVITSEYVEYDDGQYAIVSAAIMDTILNGTEQRCDDDTYIRWMESIKNLEVHPLKQKAVKALEAVLSDHSELKELWEDNEELYSSWREDKLSIIKRLQA